MSYDRIRWAVLGTLVLPLLAGDPKPVVKTQGFLPFADAPIHYRTSRTLGDQISILNRQLKEGTAKLEYEPRQGYLRSALKLLGIPESSQTLVYSKTSLQFQNISPRTPRALYFNDNVYVGQVQNGRSLEFISFDATQGAVFYVLSEERVDEPRFERAQMDCVQCHIAAGTRRIPGVVVRSVETGPSGNPKGGAPIYTMGHETPFDRRWGGWYVTGNHKAPPLETAVDTSRYLTPHSDVVAHLVLAHQTQMHNYITETNYRFRLGGKLDSVEETLKYLLFVGEEKLPAPIGSDSRFAKEFAGLGPRDAKGRSLRDFDLQTRIFKYPCSYLIYSDAFDAIPGPARDLLLRRLFEVLSGRDQSEPFAALTTEARRAILEILVDTKPGLPGEWKQYLATHPLSPIPTPASEPAQPNR